VRRYALDVAIFAGRHPEIVAYPDDTLEGSLMSQSVGVFQKVWRSIGAVDVKDPDLLLLAAGDEVRGG